MDIFLLTMAALATAGTITFVVAMSRLHPRRQPESEPISYMFAVMDLRGDTLQQIVATEIETEDGVCVFWHRREIVAAVPLVSTIVIRQMAATERAE